MSLLTQCVWSKMGTQLNRDKSEVPPHLRDSLNEVNFSINGTQYKVSKDIPLDTTLSTFIRRHAQLAGTKVMCQEGGCGACVVAVRTHHTVTGQPTVQAVNSCLVPVYGCEGWEVVTVEGLGSQYVGYHPLQALLAAHNGTQCGFCSPGMVVNMFSLVEDKSKVTKEVVEHSFDGNICRCTGYRPILEAFKTVAADNKKQLQCEDIEDMLKDCLSYSKHSRICNKKSGTCERNCLHKKHEFYNSKDHTSAKSILIDNGTEKWFRPSSKAEIFEILSNIGQGAYRFVAGNTGHGVYRDEKEYQYYIDVGGVGELRKWEVSDQAVTVGVSVTLSELIARLRDTAASRAGLYHYMESLADHLSLVANVPVRNVGTIAGNLCIKKQHPDFPSDIFLLLETVGAHLLYEKENGMSQSTNLIDFLTMDLNKVLLTHVVLPPLVHNEYIIRTFKIMARARNVPAYVNAGFCFKVDKTARFQVLERPTIVFGGIASNFVHAKETESLLEGKCLLEEAVLTKALESLQTELKPESLPSASDPQYRVGLAFALFYKFMLGLCPDGVNAKYRSGADQLSRPVSSSVRDYDTDKTVWPINKPMPKVEALYQCSGEAQYIDDIPSVPGELHAALVLSTVGQGTIQDIDPSKALEMPGVVAFYSAKDIPGVNSFTTGFPDDEPVFSDSKILYHGQAVGIVLAETQSVALAAATKVIVQYTKVSRPVLDMRAVLRNKGSERITQQAEITPSVTEASEPDPDVVSVSGEVDLGGQYHFTMELQTCLCVPVEDGMDVYSSTQWMEHVHNAVSRVLNVPAHRLNMKVRRLGGGYGAKLTRSTLVAAQCAVAAKVSNRPVRLVLSLETNMAVMGKRYDCLTQYKVDVNKKTGKICRLEGTLYEDAGWSENDPVVESTLAMLPSAYDASTWNVKGSFVKTDKASSTWCRSPGSAEAIGTIEAIMENIAETTGLDPVTVRLANMLVTANNPVPTMFEDWIKHTEYKTRLEEINKYNSENRWKQRGISVVPMTYKLFLASRYNAMVTIYAVDGTVAVSHGGIECGQGINTKVVQVCAYGLGVDVSLIQVKPTDILVSPNNEGTGGSISSESVCFAVMECCRKLNERLEPIRNMLPAGYTWQELIQKAYSEQVKLNTSYLFTSKDGVKDYDIYGVTVAEVEVDILTGQYQLTRVDIVEDAGVSLSPEIDIGQVEGAFVMGLGYYMLEQLTYDPQGKLLTNRTWNYYPPGPLDIPVDFRIQLRKKSPNPLGILRSKATGEPPLCMSVAVPLAVCHALRLPQSAAGATPTIQHFQTPYTPEKIFLSCKNDISFYKYS